MTTAQFIARLSQNPREVIAEDDSTRFSAILQRGILTVRFTNGGISKKIAFDAGDFVRQMAWLLDIEEGAA